MRFVDHDALDYHRWEQPGKLEVKASKPCATQEELSLAYTPGVAAPCLAIHENPEQVYDYTTKGNLVAVISDGSAVLGLGNIGALASKPVMEGKCVLMKRFANINAFDLELDTQNAEELIRTVQILQPSFGGINLEDIKAPECFEIEKRLKETLDIPVFHDDQHGTAIIAGAGLINALELAGKRMDQVKVVFSGAGAAGFTCAKYFLSLGVPKQNLIMTDIEGVVYKGRGDNNYLDELATDTDMRTLREVIKGADVFVGVSAAGVLTPEMLLSMNENPIVFAMANPVPEIDYDLAIATRSDVIMATGRSDYPNQINNVLGFPFIFRGALDVLATDINEMMKLAATYSLAALAREEVPQDVLSSYGLYHLEFGRDYIIPKPFDKRVLYRVAPAVAWAAMKTGVARKDITNWRNYRLQLERLLGASQENPEKAASWSGTEESSEIFLPEVALGQQFSDFALRLSAL